MIWVVTAVFVPCMVFGMSIVFALGIPGAIYILLSDLPVTMIPAKMFSGVDVFVLLGDLPLESGTEHKVEWETNGTLREVASVQLFYTVDGGLTWKQMQGSPVPDNPGTFSWTVPTLTRDKDKCKVKVVLKDDASKSLGNDVSDAFFKVEKSDL